jgi:xylono-1,5-lactonase
MAKLEFLVGGFGLVEALRVDEHGRIYFSELFGDGGVFCRNPEDRVESIVKQRKAGGMAFRESGGLVLNGPGMAVCDARGGQLRHIFTHWDGQPIRHLNDLTVAPDGSVITGSWGFDMPTREEVAGEEGREVPPQHPTGSLFRIDPSGTAAKLDDGILVSNGIGFSPDSRRLYLADTGAGAIFVYDVGPGWTVGNRREFARVTAGAPDGLAVDAEGGVWTACYGGGEVERFRPDGSSDLGIRIPALKVTTLVFGGRGLRDLYIATADNTEDPSKGGSIYRMHSNIAGLPVPKAKL